MNVFACTLMCVCARVCLWCRMRLSSFYQPPPPPHSSHLSHYLYARLGIQINILGYNAARSRWIMNRTCSHRAHRAQAHTACNVHASIRTQANRDTEPHRTFAIGKIFDLAGGEVAAALCRTQLDSFGLPCARVHCTGVRGHDHVCICALHRTPRACNSNSSCNNSSCSL